MERGVIQERLLEQLIGEHDTLDHVDYQHAEHLLKTDPDADTTKGVDRSYVNLLRMWADL